MKRALVDQRLFPLTRRSALLIIGLVAGSSNGRTPGSGPVDLGSNPSPAASPPVPPRHETGRCEPLRLDQLRSRFQEYTVVLQPDEDRPEWWAGAPSVCRDASGTFWMACRMREGLSPRGRRGYEIRILRSDDGLRFVPVHALRREDVPIAGFERPALLYDQGSGMFGLYGCGPSEDGEWAILRWDDAPSPELFVPSTARRVISAKAPDDCERTNAVRGYKDPFIIRLDGEWHCFAIGVDRAERAYHFRSVDGANWRQVGDGPAFDLAGWHSFCTRPACLLPIGVGWLLVYEGSHPTWHDPVYNIATGIAWTADLSTFVDLTPSEPLLTSTTPGNYATWRYSHWMWVDGDLHVYAEVSRPNDTNEIRAWRLTP